MGLRVVRTHGGGNILEHTSGSRVSQNPYRLAGYESLAVVHNRPISYSSASRERNRVYDASSRVEAGSLR